MTEKLPALESVIKTGLETSILVNTLNKALQDGSGGIDEILQSTEQAFNDLNSIKDVSVENVEAADWREELYKTQQFIKGLQAQLQRLEVAHRKVGKMVAGKGFNPVTTEDYQSLMKTLASNENDDPGIVQR